MDSYTPERWSLLSNLLGEALERSEVDREAFLDEACAGDEQLRLEVDQLLRSYYRAQATERFERGALDLVEGAFPQIAPRSEERRVGKECRYRWWTDQCRKKIGML